MLIFMQVDDRQLIGICLLIILIYHYTLKFIKLMNGIVFLNSFKGINYKLQERLVRCLKIVFYYIVTYRQTRITINMIEL